MEDKDRSEFRFRVVSATLGPEPMFSVVQLKRVVTSADAAWAPWNPTHKGDLEIEVLTSDLHQYVPGSDVIVKFTPYKKNRSDA